MSDYQRYPRKLCLINCMNYNSISLLVSLQKWISSRVSGRNSVAGNCAELRATVRNCTQLFSNFAQLCGIARNCAELCGVYRTRNCTQIKSTCVGNPTFFLLRNHGELFSKQTTFLVEKKTFDMIKVFKSTHVNRTLLSLHGGSQGRVTLIKIMFNNFF